MFTGHIALALYFICIAGGIIIIYFSQKYKSQLLKITGSILVIGSLLGVACVTYFMAKYYFHGHYEHAPTFGMEMRDPPVTDERTHHYMYNPRE